MALSLAYNDDLGRVQASVTGLPVHVDTVHFERSMNSLYWETVRGGAAVPVVAGAAVLDDYEFAPDIENHYRATPFGEAAETASITPDSDGLVWLKSVKFPFLNRPVALEYVDNEGRASKSSLYEIQGRSVPVAATDVRASQAMTYTIRTEGLEAARDMDLIFASGGVFYIQVPAGDNRPGGYVLPGDVSKRRYSPISDIYDWVVPCRVVAAPGPGVVGGTMTYGALIRLYGSYANVLAANPTYASLLDLMASPDDLVVL